MSCCGMTPRTRPHDLAAPRPAAVTAPAVTAPAIAAPAARGTPAAAAHEVMLRYTGNASVRVLGPVTGRAYLFGVAAPVQAVMRQDSAALLATAQFRREA